MGLAFFRMLLAGGPVGPPQERYEGSSFFKGVFGWWTPRVSPDKDLTGPAFFMLLLAAVFNLLLAGWPLCPPI